MGLGDLEQTGYIGTGFVDLWELPDNGEDLRESPVISLPCFRVKNPFENDFTIQGKQRIDFLL